VELVLFPIGPSCAIGLVSASVLFGSIAACFVADGVGDDCGAGIGLGSRCVAGAAEPMMTASD
jgi:hypothetical protein